MDNNTIASTNLEDIDFFKRGKVRDIYNAADNLLIVSTDRISCFDVVLPTQIPDKGKVLTKLSNFWFDFTSDIISNHLITSNCEKFPEEFKKYSAILEGRSMLVKKTKPLLLECVVRGYLSGSGWKEYSNTGSVCGISLPEGLKQSSKLPEPIFTPSTKEDSGHDINVSQNYAEKELGSKLFDIVKQTSLKIYKKALNFAESKGIIIADTKFEFGLLDGKVILIDEILTPDSSRFWPKQEYKPGTPQASFDKQFVRDYLENINWDKNPPAPELPLEIVKKTSLKYLQALEMITGKKL